MEQLAKEYLAMPGADREGRKEPPAPWGIISIKAQVRGRGHGSSAQGIHLVTCRRLLTARSMGSSTDHSQPASIRDHCGSDFADTVLCFALSCLCRGAVSG